MEFVFRLKMVGMEDEYWVVICSVTFVESY